MNLASAAEAEVGGTWGLLLEREICATVDAAGATADPSTESTVSISLRDRFSLVWTLLEVEFPVFCFDSSMSVVIGRLCVLAPSSTG